MKSELSKRAIDLERICIMAEGKACTDPSAFIECISALATYGPLAQEKCNKDCTIRIVDCPEVSLQSDGSGGGSPFDGSVLARSPTHPEASYSTVAAPSAKLELKDDSKPHITARAPGQISEQVRAAIPGSVREAMLNDPNAAQSLANEFSGNSFPQWYAKLPSTVKNYYATITSPPTMSEIATQKAIMQRLQDPKPLLDAWVASIRAYKSQISTFSAEAAQHSREAKQLSKAARSKSIQASIDQNGGLATSALRQSVTASVWSSVAASESRLAVTASRAVDRVDDRIEASASSGDVKLAFYSSMFGAVACLLLAIGL